MYNKEMLEALFKFKQKFHQLTQENEDGEYNFYVQHFIDEYDDAIPDAIDDLVEDKTGYFEEFALDQMHDEVLELARAICRAEVWVTYFAFYNPAAIFNTREEYVADEIKRAKEARSKLDEHYKQLANYYNKGVNNHDDTISTDC